MAGLLPAIAILGLLAQAAVAPRTDGEQAKPGESPPAAPVAQKTPADEPPIVTKREARVAGQTLRYTVTTGFLPIRNDAGDTEARMFFMAYTADGVADRARRPLMFSFNGGPGSSSVWLHLGALGPRRVRMNDDGTMPAPPFELVDNDATWLDRTDLVFIDPVGTGYSRAAKPDLGKKFWGVEGDIASVGEFIRLYLARYDRWASPLFLVGESYGTTRAAGLAGHLVDRGVALNGVILVSSILNFQTARFTKGNDLPAVLFLPTYTATAWYHKKLPPDLQGDLRRALDEAERFALGEYAAALAQGDGLAPADRERVARQVARLTGLDAGYVDRANLRIEIQRFCKELLRSERRTVGRLDSRFTGFDEAAVDATPEFDPSMAAIRPPYTAAFQHYVANELGYRSDATYYILGGGIGQWDWGEGNRFADTSEALRRAFARNPHMRVLIASGFYDLATPYFATEYTVRHMGLDPSVRGRVRTATYEAGHMMYIDTRMLALLKRDVSAFLDTAIAR